MQQYCNIGVQINIKKHYDSFHLFIFDFQQSDGTYHTRNDVYYALYGILQPVQ